jgi:Zn-dependent M28 family amino/carboxypeptidase
MDVESDRGDNSMRMSGPVMMMSAERADEMVQALDLEGRTLADFVEIANAGVAAEGDDGAETGVIPLPGGVVSMDVQLDREPITTENVGAVLPGRGDLADEFLVIGAHFDHVGVGAFGTRAPGRVGEVHPGADDNASGTSGVLLTARKLTEAYGAMGDDANARSIIFLLFSGEERGLLGSRHYTETPSVPLDSVICMLNMDMIGRLRDGVEVEGLDENQADERIAGIVQPILDKAEVPVGMRGPTGNSDHASFRAKGVQILNFHTGLHEEYHTPDDVAATIDDAGAVRVVELVTDIALALATDGAFSAEDRRAEAGDEEAEEEADDAPKVSFGVAVGDPKPDDLPEEPRGIAPGALVTDLEGGSPAAQAGVLVGDRIVRWNNAEIKDAAAWNEVLAEHAPGDFVEFYVMRDGKALRMFVILGAP